jgi:hypothetical protein
MSETPPTNPENDCRKMESTGRFTVELKRLKRNSYDRCSECGKQIPKGVAALAGYVKDNRPIYVGPYCEQLLSERASHIYWWWEVYKLPEPNTPLWRFMDFAKFVALLKDRALYFARADRLGDRFEGARGIATRKTEWDEYCLEYFRHAVRNPPPGNESPSDDVVERESQRLLRDFEEIGEQDVKTTYVSCWHENDSESEALWRLYCSPSSAGIAIRTDSSALIESLGDNPDIQIGRVQYIDFGKKFAGTHDRIFWKRKSLSHEAEVRAVIKRFRETKEEAILIPVDLSKLIKAVVVSPFAPMWFDDVLREVMRRFDVRASVVSSELLAEPFF